MPLLRPDYETGGLPATVADVAPTDRGGDNPRSARGPVLGSGLRTTAVVMSTATLGVGIVLAGFRLPAGSGEPNTQRLPWSVTLLWFGLLAAAGLDVALVAAGEAEGATSRRIGTGSISERSRCAGAVPGRGSTLCVLARSGFPATDSTATG